MSIIAKNTTQSDIVIGGVTIEAEGQHTVQPSEIYLWASSNDLVTKVGSGDIIINDGTADLSAADGIRQVQGSYPKVVSRYALSEGGALRARLIGIHHNATATKNTTTNLDWKIPNVSYGGSNKQSYMDGIQFKATDAVDGDKMSFQVIDIDNILGYGAGTVLDEFGKDWAVMPDKEETMRLYKAKLIPNLYIRLVYVSIGTTNDVKLNVNLFRHMDTDIDL